MDLSPVEALLGTFCSLHAWVHGQGTSKLPARDTTAILRRGGFNFQARLMRTRGPGWPSPPSLSLYLLSPLFLPSSRWLSFCDGTRETRSRDQGPSDGRLVSILQTTAAAATSAWRASLPYLVMEG